MQVYARQGDLVISKAINPRTDLTAAKVATFAGDSSGHPHTLHALQPMKIKKDGRTTHLEVTGTERITHGRPDGHADVVLEPGNYIIRPLRERGDQDDRAVED